MVVIEGGRIDSVPCTELAGGNWSIGRPRTPSCAALLNVRLRHCREYKRQLICTSRPSQGPSVSIIIREGRLGSPSPNAASSLSTYIVRYWGVYTTNNAKYVGVGGWLAVVGGGCGRCGGWRAVGARRVMCRRASLTVCPRLRDEPGQNHTPAVQAREKGP